MPPCPPVDHDTRARVGYSAADVFAARLIRHRFAGATRTTAFLVLLGAHLRKFVPEPDSAEAVHVRPQTPFCLHRRYVLNVPEDPITEELKLTQLDREQAERRRARDVPDEDEAAQHERRAEKAKYLAEKLEERAESERRQDD